MKPHLSPPSRLYTHFDGVRCLSYIDTEGYVDPTGHAALNVNGLRAAWQGTKVHKAVEAYFMEQFAGSPFYTPRVEVPNKAGRADMVLTMPTGNMEVYELKPLSHLADPKKDAAGKAQLAGYAEALPAVPGTTWQPNGKPVPYPGDDKKEIVLHTSPKDPGMVYYEVRQKPQRQPETSPQPQYVPNPGSSYVPLLFLTPWILDMGVNNESAF